MSLRLRPMASRGLVHDVTPASAGWDYVGFALHRLAGGDAAGAQTGACEHCLVLVEGAARIVAGGQDLGIVGARGSPFDGPPDAVYVPMGSSWRAEAVGGAELAVCSAPGGPGFIVRKIPAGTYPATVRGTGANIRHVTSIMPESDGAAASLLVVEVVTPAGNTSSYPPHKHDRDAPPDETYLEETYYHRLDPPQGFALQRVWTDDRALDEAVVVEDRDVVLVPRGYHPVATVHGYRSYYLNVMAGPKRTWRFHNAPEHAWLFTGV